MIRSLLVPLDGSLFGEHALPLALSIARRAGATIRLAHVHVTVTPESLAGVTVMDDTDSALRQLEMAYLETTTKRLAGAIPVKVSPVLLEGEPAEALRAHAEAMPADLVVMCTHGRGALARFWLGSVADEMVRHCSLPVLLIRPSDTPADLAGDPIFKQIVLPLDGTPLAEQMIEPALELGALMGAGFTLLRVVKPVIRPNYLPEGTTLEGLHASYLEGARAQQTRLEEEARTYLEGVAARLRGRAPRVASKVIADEAPAASILREAQAHEADLIALATHGRRGLSRWLLGSVADKVVRASPVPVLVQRPRA